jgi:hypothetical protein
VEDQGGAGARDDGAGAGARDEGAGAGARDDGAGAGARDEGGPDGRHSPDPGSGDAPSPPADQRDSARRSGLRDWIGDSEDLIPFGPRSAGTGPTGRAQPSREHGVDALDAGAFWTEDSAEIHHAVQRASGIETRRGAEEGHVGEPPVGVWAEGADVGEPRQRVSAEGLGGRPDGPDHELRSRTRLGVGHPMPRRTGWRERRAPADAPANRRGVLWPMALAIVAAGLLGASVASRLISKPTTAGEPAIPAASQLGRELARAGILSAGSLVGAVERMHVPAARARVHHARPPTKRSKAQGSRHARVTRVTSFVEPVAAPATSTKRSATSAPESVYTPAGQYVVPQAGGEPSGAQDRGSSSSPSQPAGPSGPGATVTGNCNPKCK